MKKFTTLILAASLLSSCGKDSGGSSTPASPAPKKVTRESGKDSVEQKKETAVDIPKRLTFTVERAVELNADHSNLEEYKDNINNWNLKFKAISGDFYDAHVACDKNLFTQKKSGAFVDFNTKGTEAIVQVKLEEDDPITVEVECFVRLFGEEIDSFKWKLHKSFVVSGLKDYQAIGIGNLVNGEIDNEIETLLLEEDAIIRTENNDVNLRMNELISFGGHIETYTMADLNKALENEPGRSGGQINLITKKAIGKLNVYLRGGNAGKRTTVPPAKTSAPPAPKRNTSCSGKPNPKFTQCYGEPGLPGENGEIGYPGLSGGNTGSIKFTVVEPTAFHIAIKYQVGLGSAGGEGGQSGVGGNGGEGARVEWRECTERENTHGGIGGGGRGMKAFAKSCPSHCQCYSYTYPKGPQGKPGKTIQGPSGSKGRIQYSEVRMGKRVHTIKVNTQIVE